jgi:hypothetical protein
MIIALANSSAAINQASHYAASRSGPKESKKEFKYIDRNSECAKIAPTLYAYQHRQHRSPQSF